MSARLVLAGVAFAGLVLSVWLARPLDATHLPGWRTAVLWASMAWLLLLALIVPWIPVSGIVAAILMAGAVELVVLLLNDPLVAAAKPLYQVPPLLACAWLGIGGRTVH